MDDPRTVPAASSADLEEFFADGSPAYPAETTETSCCTRVNVPGVGPTHAFDCPHRPGAVNGPGRPYMVGEVPATLRRALQGDLLSRLMFAARNLAQANIIMDTRDDGVHILGTPLSCRDCHFGAT
jgi:hypothetical protein